MAASEVRGSESGSSSQEKVYDEKFNPIQHSTTATTFDANAHPIAHQDTAGTTLTSFEGIVGNVYDESGNLILIPAKTQDPRDPMNMTFTHKMLAMFFLCCYGSFAAAAELILGAMLPVFALEYAGITDPMFLKTLTDTLGGFAPGVDSLSYLAALPGAPPLIQVYLLASLPVLIIGITNLAFIPLAISVGRRPVIIGCGFIAIAGAIWAGYSKSLASHLCARCLQAFGAGTVESLIPFIIQDIAHHHQRNAYISTIFAAQGVIIIAIGIASPHLITYLSWRWVYFITAAAAGFFLVGVILFLPETRWQRTRSEMNGIPRQETKEEFEPRTFKYNLTLFQGGINWNKGWVALKNTLSTFFYPHIFFITMLNSVMIACAFAAGYTASPALLTQPWSWKFLNLGLCLLPTLIAAICVGLVTGVFADKVVNYMAKKNGRRLPEYQLLNLIFPTVIALVGTIMFGISGNDQIRYPWIMFIIGLGFMSFGFLGANTVGAVYVLECYPQLAGPALVNIASFRCLIAFALSFGISEWVLEIGYLNSMLIYTGLIAAFGLFIPVVYIYGPAWRKRWPADAAKYDF